MVCACQRLSSQAQQLCLPAATYHRTACPKIYHAFEIATYSYMPALPSPKIAQHVRNTVLQLCLKQLCHLEINILVLKCFEDNGFAGDLLEQNGRVLVVDGGVVLFVAHWSLMLNWRVWRY